MEVVQGSAMMQHDTENIFFTWYSFRIQYITYSIIVYLSTLHFSIYLLYFITCQLYVIFFFYCVYNPLFSSVPLSLWDEELRKKTFHYITSHVCNMYVTLIEIKNLEP